jgi:hypothetical protein
MGAIIRMTDLRKTALLRSAGSAALLMGLVFGMMTGHAEDTYEPAGVAVEGSGSSTPQAALQAELVSLPNFIYLGERLNLSASLTNNGDRPLVVWVQCRISGKEEVRRVEIAPGHPVLLLLPFSVGPVSATTAGALCVWGSSDCASLLRELPFALRDARRDLSDVRVSGGRFFLGRGDTPLVLVNAREDPATYRRWMPVKWAVGRRRRRTGRCVLWAPAYGQVPSTASSLAECLGTRLRNRQIDYVQYSGDPLESCLELDDAVSGNGRAVLCIAWGRDEAWTRYPQRDFERALDCAVDRLREKHPSLELILMTPPPAVNEVAVSEQYAEAIRRVARDHQIEIADIHARTVEIEDWPRFYAVNGDFAVSSKSPSMELEQLMAEWLACKLR